MNRQAALASSVNFIYTVKMKMNEKSSLQFQCRKQSDRMLLLKSLITKRKVESKEKVDRLTREKEALRGCLKEELVMFDQLNSSAGLHKQLFQLKSEKGRLLKEQREFSHELQQGNLTLKQANQQIDKLTREQENLNSQRTSRSKRPRTGSRLERKPSPSDLAKALGCIKNQLIHANVEHEEAFNSFLASNRDSASQLKTNVKQWESELVFLESEKKKLEQRICLFNSR